MYLDKDILYWSTIPILIMVFCGITLRTIMQMSSKGKKKRKVPFKEEPDLNNCLLPNQRLSLRNLEFQNHINRSNLLKTRRFLLPQESFLKRKMFYCAPNTGYFQNPPESPNPFTALSNPGKSIFFFFKFYY